MEDWVEQLPQRERLYIIKAWEKNANIKFCVDTWIENNPDKPLKLRECLRTYGNVKICPYQVNNEPCRF